MFMSCCELLYCEAAVVEFVAEMNHGVAVCNGLSVAGTEYKAGHCMILHIDSTTGLPLFGRVVQFISKSDN